MDLGTWMIQSYCSASVFALLLFDHILLSSRELNYIWRRRFTAASLIYIFIHYFTLISKLLMLVNQAHPLNRESKSWLISSILEEISIGIMYIAFSLFSTFRIYAICAKDWRPATVVLLVSLAVCVTDLYHYSHAISAPCPQMHCGDTNIIAQNNRKGLIQMYIKHGLAVVADTLVILLTWFKTIGLKKDASRLHMRASLPSLLLRDGILYFVTLLVLHVILFATESWVNMTWNPTPLFIDAFMSILMSRFILNLREELFTPSGNQALSDLFTLSSSSTVQFATPSIVDDAGPQYGDNPQIGVVENGVYDNFEAPEYLA